MTDRPATAAVRVESPGSPAPPLDVLLRIEDQPEVAARLRADLAAVDEAVRRAGTFGRARDLSDRSYET